MCLASLLIYYPLLEFAGEECLYTKYWLVGALPVYSVCTDSILQVFAIEFGDFAIEFVPFAIEFVAFAIEFVPFAIEFVAFAIEFVAFAIEFIAFAVKFVRNKNGSWSKHENMM